VEFLLKYYRHYHIIYHLIMFTGVIIGMVRLKKLCSSSRIFLLLLFITPLVELTAFYCAIHFQNNNMVYNPFIIVQFLLIGWAFFVETRQRSLLVMLILLLFTAAINGIFYEPFLTSFNNNMVLLSSLFIIIWYFMYLVFYFNGSHKTSLKKFPLFWTGTAWMLFSIVSIISFGFMKLYADNGLWDDISTYTRQVSNYMLYGSFIVSFLLRQICLNDISTGK
jgi:hypothetical protein